MCCAKAGVAIDLFYNEDQEIDVEFTLAWRFMSSDLCSSAESIIRKIDSHKAVQFDSYYLPRNPQLDAASEDIELSLMALMRENVKQTILDAEPDDEHEPATFSVYVDGHIDGAAKETILSLTLRDSELIALRSFYSFPRQV